MQIDQRISYKSLFAMALLGIGFIALGVLTRLQHEQLATEGKVTEGTVTGSRIMEKNGVRSHEVQFTFQTEPNGPQIAPGDFLGRKELWFTLPKDAFEQAVASKRLQVRFAVSKPQNARPVDSPVSAGNDWSVVGLGGGTLLIALIGFIRKKRAERLPL